MSDFEEVGKEHVANLIDGLESARPGWIAMFYQTLTYEGDIAEADALREKYEMPRPSDRQAEIDKAVKDYESAVLKHEQKTIEHRARMHREWGYWLRHTLWPKKQR